MPAQHGRSGARCATVKWLWLLGLTALVGCARPVGGFWPTTSAQPVQALHHPTLEQRVAELTPGPDQGFRFIAFGDQRALADGEWQTLMHRIGDVAGRDPRLLFMVDTGDIVQDGQYRDQFSLLRGILAPAIRLPYLVSVGNHEVQNNRSWAARENAAEFLHELDPEFSARRMYYRKEVGPLCLLFLDTNDLVYGPAAPAGTAPAAPPSPADVQMAWLLDQFRSIDRARTPTVVVVMHHPFVQSSDKHREQAVALWSRRHAGETLPDLFAAHGVDAVLVGHTHTYERFRLRRPDGRGFVVVNLSGRPRSSFLWIGDGARRARRLEESVVGWMASRGWSDLTGWDIVQEYAMVGSEANQYAVVEVHPDGGLTMEVRLLAPGADAEERSEPLVRLK
jgi:3',5'-cyclic AMP phosphodiesterase CpdA